MISDSNRRVAFGVGSLAAESDSPACIVADSTGGIALGVEMLAAEGDSGSESVVVWDSASDSYSGFERAIAVSFIKVDFERFGGVLWGIEIRIWLWREGLQLL